jgi:hypothetical protein
MGSPYVIRVTAKAGSAEIINARWKSLFGEDLIWTKARIAEQLRAVQTGHVEALADLRDKLKKIEDWNRELPDCAEDHGVVPIADHETTITQLHLLDLRKRVLFLQRYRILFQAISGLEQAYDLMGGEGSSSGIAANSSPIPSAPRSAIYRNCVRYRCLALWLDFHAFRETKSGKTWELLRQHEIPWHGDSTVEQLTEYRSTSWSAASGTIPQEMDVRRALTPCETSEDPDELPEIPRGEECESAAVTAVAPDNIVKLPGRDRTPKD